MNCPKCNGKMRFWDYWLIQGETCELCYWTIIEYETYT